MNKLLCPLLLATAFLMTAPLLAVEHAATEELPPALLAMGGDGSVVSQSDAQAVRGQAVDADVLCEIPVITVTSDDKDISNVVLKFDDGSTFKFDGLSGKEFEIDPSDFDKPIIGVYVKAGNNKSGDGPGFGEFIPLVPCPDPPGGGGGDPPGGGGGDPPGGGGGDPPGGGGGDPPGGGGGDPPGGGGGDPPGGGGGDPPGGGGGDPPTPNPYPNVNLWQDKSFSVGARSGFATGTVSLFEGVIGTFEYNKLSTSVGTDGSSEMLALNVSGNIGGLTGSISVNQDIASPDYGSLSWFTAGKSLSETTNFTGDFTQNFAQHFEVPVVPAPIVP